MTNLLVSFLDWLDGVEGWLEEFLREFYGPSKDEE